MPANVETMFSVREVPWHGLGTIVEEAPTSKDAIIMAGLDWTVEQKPLYLNSSLKKVENLYYSDGDRYIGDLYQKTTPEIDGFVANVRSSDNSVLGIVTPKYKVVQNSEAFEFTDSLIGEEIRYETAGSLREGRTIWLLAKMPEQKILDDKFDPYICFTNSHDGKGAIQVCMTPIRVVCNNTLNLALHSAKRMWTTKHMGDMQGKLAEAKHTLGLAENYMENLNIEANKLADLKISDTELEAILTAMFPIDYEKDTPRKINHVNELKANLFHCYNAPDISQFKGTAWGIMNAATDMVAHTAPARLTSNYQENNFGRIIAGHPLVDDLYTSIQKFAKAR